MQIEHIAIWTSDLERLRDFYVRYFAATPGLPYHNPNKRFASYFLSFPDGARLELMCAPDIEGEQVDFAGKRAGYAHLAFSCGSENQVNELTDRLQNDGYAVLQGPHWTGDGYYESVISDPDGNQIELTI